MVWSDNPPVFHRLTRASTCYALEAPRIGQAVAHLRQFLCHRQKARCLSARVPKLPSPAVGVRGFSS